MFDDCLIREISKHMESSHPADEYNNYKVSSGSPGVGGVFLVVAWFICIFVLPAESIDLKLYPEMLRPLVSCWKVTVSLAGKPERSQMGLLLFFISLLLDKPLFYFVGVISESY